MRANSASATRRVRNVLEHLGAQERVDRGVGDRGHVLDRAEQVDVVAACLDVVRDVPVDPVLDGDAERLGAGAGVEQRAPGPGDEAGEERVGEAVERRRQALARLGVAGELDVDGPPVGGDPLPEPRPRRHPCPAAPRRMSANRAEHASRLKSSARADAGAPEAVAQLVVGEHGGQLLGEGVGIAGGHEATGRRVERLVDARELGGDDGAPGAHPLEQHRRQPVLVARPGGHRRDGHHRRPGIGAGELVAARGARERHGQAGGLSLELSTQRTVAHDLELPGEVVGQQAQCVEQDRQPLLLDEPPDEQDAAGLALLGDTGGACRVQVGPEHLDHRRRRVGALRDQPVAHLAVHRRDGAGPPQDRPLHAAADRVVQRVHVAAQGRDDPRHAPPAEERGDALRDDPVQVDHVGSGAPHDAPHVPGLGQQERDDLQPARRPGAQVLDDGAVGEVLPAAREVAEALDLHGAEFLDPPGRRYARHEHGHVEREPQPQ